MSGMKGVQLSIRSKISEIRCHHDFAWCWNCLTVQITQPDARIIVVRSGYALFIFQKQVGNWVIVRDANMLAVVR